MHKVKFSPTACQLHLGHPTAPPMPLFPTLSSIYPTFHSSSYSRHSQINLPYLAHHLTFTHISLHRNHGRPIPPVQNSRRRLQETPSKAHRRRATPGNLPQPQKRSLISSPSILYTELSWTDILSSTHYSRSAQARISPQPLSPDPSISRSVSPNYALELA